jgi:hypothetical protein
MDSSGMGQDHLDDADVDAECYWPGTLICTLTAILEELVAIEVADLLISEVALQRCESRRLAPAEWFPCGAHIGHMKVNQVTESVLAGPRRIGWAEAPDRPGSQLGQHPFPGVVTAQERIVRAAALPSDLDPVSTGGKLGDRGHFRVRYMCKEPSPRGISGVIRAQSRVGTNWVNGLKITE